MTVTLEGKFDTRREAEMAVERLVQEHEIDRNAIRIAPEGSANSAGDEAAGSDTPAGEHTSAGRSDAPLAGEIIVCVEVPSERAGAVRAAFAEFDGETAQ